MAKRYLRTILAIIALIPALSGCVMINLLVSGVGLVVSGPLEYAGTAMTVGEYAYEYAANDKAPSQVFQEKMENLMPNRTTPEPRPQFATNTSGLRLNDGDHTARVSLVSAAERTDMGHVRLNTGLTAAPASLPNLHAQLIDEKTSGTRLAATGPHTPNSRTLVAQSAERPLYSF